MIDGKRNALYLIRHASPDWDRVDIPYDVAPGPPLSARGEQEALALAKFLKSEGVVKLYYSPFERSARTARLVSVANGIPCVEETAALEWRQGAETEAQVRERMSAVFDRIAEEAHRIGPIGLVSHGGPVSLLLQKLGLGRAELLSYARMFDHSNPLPPAGVWKVKKKPGEGWSLQLAFTPTAH